MTPYLILLAKVRGLKTHNSVKLFTKTNHEGLNIYMYRIQGVNATPVINIYFIVYHILLSYTSGQTNFLTTICFNASWHIFGGFCLYTYILFTAISFEVKNNSILMCFHNSSHKDFLWYDMFTFFLRLPFGFNQFLGNVQKRCHVIIP